MSPNMKAVLTRTDSDHWLWKISMYRSRRDTDIIIKAAHTADYEDQAANDAYDFAHKHLRPKRRKKTKRGGPA
jgi:hypothetical protein